MSEQELQEQVLLWDAVNEYAAACGGDTGQATVGDRRMDAVVLVNRAVKAMLTPPATVPEHEALAKRFRDEMRSTEDGKPEGTAESLERTANMLDTYGPECFPANEVGQVHFARAMMEGAADEIRAFLQSEKAR